MAVRPIVVVGYPVLRQKAHRVKVIDRNIQLLIDDMIDTMRAAPGVGLAAPQIGVPLRVAVIEVDGQLFTLVNPEIVKQSGEYEPEEGCLSVPGYWGTVRRAQVVVVKAKDRTGREVRIKGEGLLGQALQHEIDHLNGILYIDRVESLDQLRRVPEVPPFLERTHREAQAESVG